MSAHGLRGEFMRSKLPEVAFIFVIVFNVSFCAVQPAKSDDAPVLMRVDEHHVAGLNSNMPYIAGFHVNADDLSQWETVNSTAVTVSFPSTEPDYFPTDSWLGGGMFVQAQDHFFRNVDYGFYMMLVLEASGRMFIDVGLHQTEEETLPMQMATSSLVYASTWLVENVDESIPIELSQDWLDNSSVRYSISVSGHDEVLAYVNVVAMPNCGNIIPKFFAGNVVVDQFPFSRYVNYFQFGMMSNKVINNAHWQVDVEEPMMLRNTGWTLVDKAWLLEGDRSFLDHDLMWGGIDYRGVSVKNHQYLQNPYEIVFQYTGSESANDVILWNAPSGSSTEVPYATQSEDLAMTSRCLLPVIVALFGGTVLIPFLLVRRKGMKKT
jgi:hypothetical protein